MIEARCITGAQAAAFCNLTPNAFREWVRKGIVPGPIPGTHRWDRKALERALDKLSGIEPENRPESQFLAWKRAHEGDDARR